MNDEPFLITPPPGLLPPPRETESEPAPLSTGSETVRRGTLGVPARPVAPVAVPARAPVSPPVAAATAPVAQPAPLPPGTAPREPGPWVVRLADGTERELGVGGLVLGRNPTAPPGHTAATPVRIDDPAKSVSKTHALLLPEPGGVRVLDLKSTNGVAVTPPGGVPSPVPLDGFLAVEGAVVALGDYAVAIARR